MDFTSDELEKVKKRISEAMADVAKEQREESIGRLWVKIHDLQEQEKKLKDKKDAKKA